MSKVDVKVVSELGHHQVVVVAVAQAEHVAGHAVGGRGDDEVARPLGHLRVFGFLALVVAHCFVRLAYINDEQ